MRWIFISLVALNLTYLGYQFSQPPVITQSDSVVVPANDTKAIRLLSEIKVKARLPQQKAVKEQLCWAVGPYLVALDANNMMSRMLALDIPAYQDKRAVVVKTESWVYLPPLANKKMALRKLKELQKRKVDSYVITEGELANGISLGLFSRQESVDRLLEVLAKKKIKPLVKPLERKRNQTWLMAPISKRAPIDEKTRQGLLEGKDLQWTQVRC
jgi:hypothetical protein